MRLSAITTVLISSGVMLGCASNKPFAGMQVVPHTSTQHGAKTAAGYYTLARYFHGSARLADADKAYGDTLRLEPGHVGALAGLGMLRSEQGRHVEAVSLLRSAAARAPRSASVLNNLGYALMASGEPKLAVIELDKALAAAPDSVRIRNNLKFAHESLKKASPQTIPGETLVVSESRDASSMPAHLRQPAEAIGPKPLVHQVEVINRQPVQSIPLDSQPVTTELQTNVVKVAPAIYSVEYGIPLNAKSAVTNSEGWAQIASPATLPVTQPATAITPLAAIGHTTTAGKPVLVADGNAEMNVCDRSDAKPEGKTRLEVQNGNGTTGMAKAIGYQLASHDVKLVRLTNKTPFDVPRTIVEFSKGKQAEACALAIRFSLDVPRENLSLSPNVDVRLVLGRDLRQADALLSRNQGVLTISAHHKLQ